MSIRKKFQQIQSSTDYMEMILEDFQDCLGDIKYLNTEILNEIENKTKKNKPISKKMV